MNFEIKKIKLTIKKENKTIPKQKYIKILNNLNEDESMNQNTKVNISYIGDINNKFGIYRRNIPRIKKEINLSPFKNKLLISLCNKSIENQKPKFYYDKLSLKRNLPIRLNNFDANINKKFQNKKDNIFKTPKKKKVKYRNDNHLINLNNYNNFMKSDIFSDMIKIKKINFNSILKNQNMNKTIYRSKDNQIIFPYLNKTFGEKIYILKDKNV
jgi:hypothetical protein